MASVDATAPGTNPRRRARRGRRRRVHPLFAVIDLGTNNCRLLIAEPAKAGGFRVVDSFSRIVRLGEGVANSGLLSDAAIERTIRALKVCADRVGRHKVTHIRAITTEACRQARNAETLIARAQEEAGIVLSIVTADEEARLAAIGCAPLIGARHDGALVFDIGGGSTEIIWLRGRDGVAETVFAASIPVGVVGLAEAHGRGADRAAYETMREAMVARFAPVRAAMDASRAFAVDTHHLLGTSGTVTTLAGIVLGLQRYSRARVDGSWHASGDILAAVDRLVGLTLRGRAGVGCVGPERADLIVPGCAIFSAIHAHWPCAELRVADRGLREGMLREMAAETRA